MLLFHKRIVRLSTLAQSHDFHGVAAERLQIFERFKPLFDKQRARGNIKGYTSILTAVCPDDDSQRSFDNQERYLLRFYPEVYTHAASKKGDSKINNLLHQDHIQCQKDLSNARLP